MSIDLKSDFKNDKRWTARRANEWYARQPRHQGFNYLPSYAINQIEMFQAETFDPEAIAQDMAIAQQSQSSVRIFLHDLLWEQDREGFKSRIDQTLEVCSRYGIQPMLVLFDSCWDPHPHLGRQRDPLPGVHNSGWVQSPGSAMSDPLQYARLEAYVKDIVSTFQADPRIFLWDIWNEPDNDNFGSYGAGGLNIDLPTQEKLQYVEQLLPKAFAWARSAYPRQPLTSGPWKWSLAPGELSPIERLQLDLSDVISFHNYDDAATFQKRIEWLLEETGRPVICTEYMARTRGSTFQEKLPVCKAFGVAAYNWGGFEGKSQTNYPWMDWKPDAAPFRNWDFKKTPWQPKQDLSLSPVVAHEPDIWFHDIWRRDRTAYRAEEVDCLQTHRPRNPDIAQP